MLSPTGRQRLLEIVRESLRAALEGRHHRPADPGLPELSERCGCFVTLKTDGDLRGCLGCFESDSPLYLTVANQTAASAREDPRFEGNRLTPSDWPRIDFDISVLSPLVSCPDPASITLGVHGIYIRQGWRSGCFLPQVATETGWTVEEFWGYCCQHKAGLPRDSWRTGKAETFVFTAEVIEGRAEDGSGPDRS